MKRLILCAAAVAALLAAPVIADAKPAKHRAVHHRTVAHKGGRATVYRGNDPAGNAAVDNLNAQSLANARGGAAR